MYWYTGQLIDKNSLEISIDDPALIYGANTFTTLRIYQNNLYHPLTQWQSHQQRLKKSLEILHWPQPSLAQIEKGIQALIPHWPVLRITLFHNGKELITGRFLPEALETKQQQGITVWLTDSPLYQRSLPNQKTGNYLSAWLALQTAQTFNAQEAILTNSQGQWLETSTGNLWGWKDGIWYTPPDTEILPGIAKQYLKSRLSNLKEEPWNTKLAGEFETLAYTNSVVEVIPIHTILTGAGAIHYNLQHPALQTLKQYWQI